MSLLKLAALAALTVSLGAQQSQAPPQKANLPKFDVLSVKPSDSQVLSTRPKRSGGRMTWQTYLSYFVTYAYRMDSLQISGMPDSGSIYEMVATVRPDASDAEVRQMFQSMLRDRFHMEAHREMKEMEGYALTLAKSGLKISPAKDGEAPPKEMKDWDPEGSEGWIASHLPRSGVVETNGYRVTMSQFAAGLQRSLRTTVWDRTGLDGEYFISLQYARDETAASLDAPTIFVALRSKFGLQLERRKGPVETLVIDHIDLTPTEN